MKKNQKSYNFVSMLIILAITGSVGFVGWRIVLFQQHGTINTQGTKKDISLTQAEAIRQAEAYRPKGLCTQSEVPALHRATGAKYTFNSGCLAPGWEAIR